MSLELIPQKSQLVEAELFPYIAMFSPIPYNTSSNICRLSREKRGPRTFS